jgi:hypothetical protein
MADDNYERTKKEAELREQIAEAVKESTKNLQSYADVQKTIAKNYKLMKELAEETARNEAKINELLKKSGGILTDEIKVLQKINEQNRQQYALYQGINKELSKTKSLFKSIGGSILDGAKALKNEFIPSLSEIFQKFLAIDHLAHQTANTLGFQGTKFKLMADNLSVTREEFAAMGFDIESAYKAQSAMADATGRQVMLTKQASKAMAETARITGMEVEELAGMTGEMELFGLGAQQATSMILQMSQEASDMGLNSGQVIKKFQQNLGLLNKLNFKAGVKGLKEMAKFSEKYKIDMQDVASVADKVFRPEGAIEAAAQLQVLGGDLAALGDPFTLMYKARNSPEELAKSLTKAATASATFNEKTGEFEVNAYELDRLREAAQALGMDYSKLVETAKQGAKVEKFEGLLSGKGLDKDTMDALTGAAEMGENGAFVTIEGNPKLLKDLTASEAALFVNQKKSQAELAQQAMSVQNNFDAIKNQIMIALVKIFEKIPWDSIIPVMKKFGESIVGLIGWFSQNPWVGLGTLLALYFGPKIIWPIIQGRLFGSAAAASFNAGTGKSGGFLSKLNPKNWFKKGGTSPMPEQSTVPPTTGTPNQGGGPGGMTKGLNPMDMIKGATAILILSAALFVFAKALQEFDKLQNGWESLAIAAGGLVLLSGAMFVVSKIPTNNVIQGAVAIGVLGLAMIPLGIGMSYMQGVDWAVLLVAAAAIVGFAFAAEALGPIVMTPMFWLGLVGLAAASAVLSASLWLLSFGLDAVTPPMKMFMDSISTLPGLIVPLSLLGPALILTGAGIAVLSIALFGLAAAWYVGGSAFTEMTESVSQIGNINPSGLKASIEAINSIDVDKLNALKELSGWMSLLGATTTIKFDESLTIDGSIQLSGQAGGKNNTDWISDPIFVSKLKEFIADATKSDRNGGKA